MPSIEARNSRKLKVEQLSTLFWQTMFQDIRTTGTAVPTNRLRHLASRQRLLFASQASGRMFTEGIVKDALKKVVTDHAIELPPRHVRNLATRCSSNLCGHSINV